MKKSIAILFLIVISSGVLFWAHTWQYKEEVTSNTFILDSKKLDGNNISAWFRNNGSFSRDPNTGGSGFEWPSGSGKVLTYAAGLWLAGRVLTDTNVAVSVYNCEYLPGYIDNTGIPQGKDDPNYRVYKIVKGDTTSEDYLDWPVGQGAYLDSLNKPFLPGKQTMFYGMTDGYPESHGSNNGSTQPLKAQVQVTNWCYNTGSDPIMSNTVFSEFKIINKNSLPWQDAVISVWADEAAEELVAIGCDTNLNLGYAYCQSNSQQYGNIPPAFGFLLLQGPAKYTGNSNDTVYSFIPGRNTRKIRIGYKEIKLSSFNMFQNASMIHGDPVNFRQTYLTMQGLKLTGEAWIVPGTTTITKFPFSGDPESGTGWNQFTTMGYGNRRLLMNFGFINFNPGDTQSIIFAQVVSQGSNNLNSVTKLKQNSEYILNVFKQNFTTVGITNSISNIEPDDFKLYQNYPNPFNPSTKIKFDVTTDVKRQMSDVKLIVCNSLGREIATLVNERLNEGTYEVEFDGSNFASGIYFCKIMVNDFSQTIKMILQK